MVDPIQLPEGVPPLELSYIGKGVFPTLVRFHDALGLKRAHPGSANNTVKQLINEATAPFITEMWKLVRENVALYPNTFGLYKGDPEKLSEVLQIENYRVVGEQLMQEAFSIQQNALATTIRNIKRAIKQNNTSPLKDEYQELEALLKSEDKTSRTSSPYDQVLTGLEASTAILFKACMLAAELGLKHGLSLEDALSISDKFSSWAHAGAAFHIDILLPLDSQMGDNSTFTWYRVENFTFNPNLRILELDTPLILNEEDLRIRGSAVTGCPALHASTEEKSNVVTAQRNWILEIGKNILIPHILRSSGKAFTEPREFTVKRNLPRIKTTREFATN